MLDTVETRFPKITEEGLDDLRKRIGVSIGVTAEPWCYEATRDNIRHYAHGIGDDNPLWCDPDYAAKTNHGGIIALPSFLFCDQPHRLRLRRRLARRPRDVVGRRLDLAQAGPSQRRDLDRGPAEGPRRAPDALRRPRDPADLSRRFLQPAGRPGRRGGQLVLPHRARPRARAGHQVQGGQGPRAAPLQRAGAGRGLQALCRGARFRVRASATGRTSPKARRCR